MITTVHQKRGEEQVINSYKMQIKDIYIRNGDIAMVNKYNCWDFMKCGKGPSDNGNGKSDVCPVAHENSANGLNGGTNGGRICWIIANNGCKGKVKCSESHRENSCFQCEFRYKVMMDEGMMNVCNATGILLHKHDEA